jgi:hypothetical protein
MNCSKWWRDILMRWLSFKRDTILSNLINLFG